MEKNIYLAGVGGQGLQLAGKVLVNAADQLGYRVTYSPRYGFEKRGGLTSCYLVLSDHKIGNPRKKMQDILFLMEPKAYHSFHKCVKPDGILAINSSLITETTDDSPAKKTLMLPLYNCCTELGNMKVISAVVTGAITALLTDIFPDPIVVEKCLLESLKSKQGLRELNQKAFRMGVDLIKINKEEEE